MNGIIWKAMLLKKVFESLDIPLDISSFIKRKKIQKIVYMLKLSPKLEKLLPFEYNMYLAGPYSIDLADTYYYIYNNDVKPAEIDVPNDNLLNYAKELKKLSDRKLELITTLIELIKRYGVMDEEKFLWYMLGIKPYFNRGDIKWALNMIMLFKEKYGIRI